jgi:transcriptional regulator with XRE-family HTH domain
VIPLTRLREVRKQAFLSQEALSKASGVSEATINRLENGVQLARYVTTRKLAEALRVKPGELTDPAKSDGSARAA